MERPPSAGGEKRKTPNMEKAVKYWKKPQGKSLDHLYAMRRRRNERLREMISAEDPNELKAALTASERELAAAEMAYALHKGKSRTGKSHAEGDFR